MPTPSVEISHHVQRGIHAVCLARIYVPEAMRPRKRSVPEDQRGKPSGVRVGEPTGLRSAQAQYPRGPGTKPIHRKQTVCVDHEFWTAGWQCFNPCRERRKATMEN